MNETLRRRLIVAGQVQGVGFRPFVYRLALERALTGFVLNAPEGVIIEVQGPGSTVDIFSRELPERIPPLAVISRLEMADIELADGEEAFVIQASAKGKGHNVLISPDVATCPDCLAELFDPDDRRNGYPFTNCTNCGPRYTITRSIPYDRPMTSMACFPLCEDCRREYEDPLDRRFHAQPNACPVCGPRVWLTDRQGNELAEGNAAIEATAEALAQGRLMAIKGLGGFHLACDAGDAQSVEELRRRKERRGKPLALMVPDLETARRVVEIGEHEEALLTGWQRPIVICPARPDSGLAPGLAPDTPHLGLMLPYTPLHHLLLREIAKRLDLPALVMTSGNRGGEPIALGNREALARLGHIADLFLFHNRDILIRCDDSVLRAAPELFDPAPAPLFYRRARGYTPSPVDLVGSDAPPVLAVGPELKNTLCVTKGRQAFPSQHIGDLNNLEALGFLREMAEHLPKILQVQPELVVRDLHPDYLSSGFAQEYAEARGIPVLALQHHVAHIHAVLAENRRLEAVIGLALDGTGLGEDGTVWGGECLFVDSECLEHERLAHFSPVALPGGDAAAREPWRMARSYLHALGLREPRHRPWPWLDRQVEADKMIGVMLDKGLNCPTTTSCGRLFDAVAGLLGVCETIGYEGQAAIRLEAIQDMRETGAYDCPMLAEDQPVVLDTLTLFAQAFEDWEAGTAPAVVARRFHRGLALGLANLAASLAGVMGLATVAMSGGVMQNLTLARELPEALLQQGLEPLTHRLVPPNDACVSLGQAAWGRRKLLL